MKTLYQSLLLALAGTAFAQVPSTNDTSDAYGNTGMGTDALFSVTPSSGCGTHAVGACNTASGYQALYSNTTGSNNTASGYQALYSNTLGFNNTAFGYQALYANKNGGGNTASGYQVLQSNTTGGGNTASGYSALNSNTTGSGNTVTGEAALFLNTTGSNNTASGIEALYNNTNGGGNSAFGYFALNGNTSGRQNTASGTNALHTNHTGDYNTASGTEALYSNTTGSFNIAEGYKAGLNVTTGSNNIEIGSEGASTDDGVINIGTQGTQMTTSIAGISGASVSGSAVYVSSTGQLGLLSSSERFKTAITPMGASTGKLDELRPVTFQYKTDPQGARQYGLIAEEVAKVYPELVVRDAKGKIISVRYDELAPMLLNEVQQLKQQLVEMHAALDKLQSKDERVAQR